MATHFIVKKLQEFCGEHDGQKYDIAINEQFISHFGGTNENTQLLPFYIYVYTTWLQA